MKSLFLVGCLFVCSVCARGSYAEVSRVLRSERSLNALSSEQNYKLMVREQGSRFTENVRFDMNEKTAVFEVPVHRDLDHAIVMIDFNSNLTATRLPGENECHVRAHTPEEPSLDPLKSSMDKVSNETSSLNSGTRSRSSIWTIKGPADFSKLSSKIIDFCRGSPILELLENKMDGVGVVNGNGRSRRSSTLPIPLCTTGVATWAKLVGCNENQWVIKCKFSSRSGAYWVTCPNGLMGMRKGECSSKRQRVRLICCDLSCPC